MKRMWQQWQQRFAALPKRRRLLWVGVITSVTAVVSYQQSWAPYLAERERVRLQWQQAQQQQQQLREQIDSVTERLRGDPNLRLSTQELQAKRRLKALEERIENDFNVSQKQQSSALLQQILSAAAELTILEVNTLQQNIDAAENLQQNGFELVVEANYQQFHDFMEDLQAVQPDLLWQQLDYQVSEYPRATIRLQIMRIGVREDAQG